MKDNRVKGKRKSHFEKAKVQVCDLTQLLSNRYYINLTCWSSRFVSLAGGCAVSIEGKWKNPWPLNWQWLSGNNKREKKNNLIKEEMEIIRYAPGFWSYQTLSQCSHKGKWGLAADCLRAAFDYFQRSAITASDSKRLHIAGESCFSMGRSCHLLTKTTGAVSQKKTNWGIY